MNLFENFLKEDESLFINPEVLDYDYLPKLLPYRENKQHYLASCIKPLFLGRNGQNVLITGKPGIGKTAASKFILRDLEFETEKIVPIYINCWKKDTPHKIILEICKQIGYKWVQNKKTDELMKVVADIFNKKSAVFVFDEIDKIDSDQMIYQLLEDIYKKCIFLITNDKGWLIKLDNRVRSRLIPEIVEFEAYSLSETEGILRQRLEYAFVPKVWSDEAFEIIVSKASELEDIRIGLFLLREAGQIAEDESSKKILARHAEEALKKLNSFKIISSKNINDEDKEILSLIKSNKGKISTEIHAEYNKDHNKTYRTFQRKIKDLADAGLIEIIPDITSKGGKISRLQVVEKK
ncbi:MAG: AAA family ATPase [Nanoarchaeota archaeon]|nr:AAA family ATPase [Nanoarchaeota archaeon]